MEHVQQSAPGRAPAEDNTHTNHIELPPRLLRLSRALLSSPRSGRELVDIIPANNPAEYVRQLRQGHGLCIPCEHVRCKTVDGGPSWYGVYHLTPEDREKLIESIPVDHEN